jgi:hypothetical protein
MSKVKAMWLGPAGSGRGTLTDPKTKKVWVAGVTIHEIDEADAERLSSGPHGDWDLDPKPAAKPVKITKPALKVDVGIVVSSPSKSKSTTTKTTSSRPKAATKSSEAPSTGGE